MDKVSHDRIEAEILCCVALCVNDWNYGAKEILLRGISNDILVEFLAHFGAPYISHHIHYINPTPSAFPHNVKQYPKALDLKINQFDIIIDLDNTSTESYDVLLKPSGILLINLPSLEQSDVSFEKAKDVISQSHFHVKMPFCVNDKYYLFLSNQFHPLADISLQKIDTLEGLQYYNASIGEAIFALPTYLKNALKGVAQN